MAVAPSAYAHERAGLDWVRERLPDADPYRAWSNFEIVTDRGEALEVDLLVLGPKALYLVELKSWEGPLRGDRYRWILEGQGRHVYDNPFLAANRKAKVLKGIIEQAAWQWGQHDRRIPPPQKLVPWVQAAVFLHSPGIVSGLAEEDRLNAYGLDGEEDRTNLPGLVSGLLTKEPDDPDRRISAQRSAQLRTLFEKRIGFTRRRVRQIGGYDLGDKPIDEGPTWQDYFALHHRFRDDARRVRVYYVGRATTDDERRTIERAAEREYRILRHIDHPGLVAPLDFHDTSEGPALLFPYDPHEQPLDHFLSAHPDQLDIAGKLAIIRGVAEILRYAHGRHITHRGMSPRSVLIKLTPEGPLVRIADWQTGARVGTSRTSSPGGVLAGTRHVEAFLDPLRLVYQAPESFTASAEGEVQMDVFGLGAISYLVLTGRPPAPDPITLRERLRRDGGLDLSADLRAAPETQRQLVLEATRGDVGARTPDMDAFIANLARVEESNASPPEEAQDIDPVDAPPDTLLAGRWKVVRRLGAGSSAVALLVVDELRHGVEAVLKVALNAEKAERLREELDVLTHLSDPQIVKLHAPELLEIGERTAIALEHAGDVTLAGLIRKSGRLSLALLERYGDDLFRAASYLDQKAVNHRDIKPENLGVRPRASDRQPHLVLFDFSLSRTPAADLHAGTPPYLDPFLGMDGRTRWDAAAERYGVAVTLFEMATGRPPVYGDGQSDPAVISDEAAVSPELFDPAVADALTSFFQRALLRKAADRYGSVDEMRRAWDDAVRGAAERSAAPDPDALASRATRATPLSDSGLTPRALSALDSLNLTTVGDLLDVPAFNLSRLAGTNEATRREIRSRAKAWRDRLKTSPSLTTREPGAEHLQARSVDAVVNQLIPRRTGRNDTEIAAAKFLLGLEAPPPNCGLAPPVWLAQVELADLLQLTAARGQQLDAQLRTRWARSDALQGVRDDVVDIVASYGGVATADELAAGLLALRGSVSTEPARNGLAMGLVRAAVEAELEHGGDARLDRGRRGGVMYVAQERGANDPGPSADEIIDYAAALARAAASLGTEPETPVAPTRALDQLRRVPTPGGMAPLAPGRLLRLAAARRDPWVVSSRDELYPNGMSAASALRHSGAGFAPALERLSVETLRERVQARYPEAEPLPDRPSLDRLLEETGSPLRWDADNGCFSATNEYAITMSTFTSRSSGDQREARPGLWQEIDRRLRDSRDQGTFLAIGVRSGRLTTTSDALAAEYGLTTIDVRSLLLDRMREVAQESGIPWEEVLRADATERGTQPKVGLQNLASKCVTEVERDIRETAGPVLLVEPGPLARYDRLDVFARLADHTTARDHATWLLVPLMSGARGPVLDRDPLPVLSTSQWLVLPHGWSPRETKTKVPA